MTKFSGFDDQSLPKGNTAWSSILLHLVYSYIHYMLCFALYFVSFLLPMCIWFKSSQVHYINVLYQGEFTRSITCVKSR